jgi:hypothetical protein
MPQGGLKPADEALTESAGAGELRPRTMRHTI